MFTMDQVHTIRELYYNQGLTMAEVAEKVNCNWKTVRKYIDQEDFSPPKPVPESEVIHESKLDPYKPIIDQWLIVLFIIPQSAPKFHHKKTPHPKVKRRNVTIHGKKKGKSNTQVDRHVHQRRFP